MSESRLAKEVINDCPTLLTEVVTIGKPNFSTILPNQWSGNRIPIESFLGWTNLATAFVSFSGRIMVYAPGRWDKACFASSFKVQFLLTQSKEGTHIEKGVSGRSFIFLILVTAFSSKALHPKP